VSEVPRPVLKNSLEKESATTMIIDPDFLDHWKTKLLQRKVGPREGLEALLRLWGHCQNRRRWIFDLTPDRLASICNFDGEAGLLWAVMVDEHDGWLVRHASGQWEVRGWHEKNATLAVAWTARKKGAKPDWLDELERTSTKKGSLEVSADASAEISGDGAEDGASDRARRGEEKRGEERGAGARPRGAGFGGFRNGDELASRVVRLLGLFPGRVAVPSQAERMAVEANAGVILGMTEDQMADLERFYAEEDVGRRWRPRGLQKLVETLPDVLAGCAGKKRRTAGAADGGAPRLPDSFPEVPGWKALVARTTDYGPDPWPEDGPEWRDMHRDQQLGLLRCFHRDGLLPAGYVAGLGNLPQGVFTR
jgi:hypothetical protein